VRPLHPRGCASGFAVTITVCIILAGRRSRGAFLESAILAEPVAARTKASENDDNFSSFMIKYSLTPVRTDTLVKTVLGETFNTIVTK
jgi:hypothetical protein